MVTVPCKFEGLKAAVDRVQYGLEVANRFTVQLVRSWHTERVAEARRRLVEVEERQGLKPRAEHGDISGLTIEEILRRGRMRNAAR